MMKLRNVTELVFKELEKQAISRRSLADKLDIYPQAVSMWAAEESIPAKYIGRLRAELNIPKDRLFRALKADFDLTLKMKNG